MSPSMPASSTGAVQKRATLRAASISLVKRRWKSALATSPRAEGLDGDQPGLGVPAGQVDDAHPALTQSADDGVRANSLGVGAHKGQLW
ncbi:hypothetical protein ACQEVF_17545 [Nonomuraea polychroma]|uniref:hypothetical protein n=1 Tax=Nonomuraea polychroma TaxID=46176 RepID=UPI003D91A3E1